MAVADIALHESEGFVRLSDVAHRQNIALGYLEQIFTKLKSFSIVKASRGPKGGYALSQSTSLIKISQIIDAVEEEIKITRCSKQDSGCVVKGAKCMTHDLWHGLGDTIRQYLDSVSIDDVINNRLNNRGLGNA